MRGGDNKAVVRRFWQEVFNEGNLDAADEIFARDHVVHHPVLPERGRGSGVMKAIVAMFRQVSPDVRATVEAEVAEGDDVVTLWTARGEPAPSMRGNADPEVVVSGIGFFRVEGGRIQETWLRFESHENYRRPKPKDRAVREQLAADPLLEPLGETMGFWKCFFRPGTCATVAPEPSGE